MVSVIVPVYNVEQYLKEAIESIIGQTYKDIEIILVDDGSTDKSGNICDEYKEKDDRIKVIHQENKGLSGARNSGLDVCAGEFVAFLDSDDALASDAIEKWVEVFEKTGADIVESNYAIYKGDKPMDETMLPKLPKRIAPNDNSEGLYTYKEALLLQCFGKIGKNVWNKLYRRHIWDKIRFPEGQNYEDVDIILQVLGEAEKVYILDDKLVMHRKRKGSITDTNSEKNKKDWELAYIHYWEYVDKHIMENCDVESRQFLLEGESEFFLSLFFSYVGRSEEKKKIDFISNKIHEILSKIDINLCHYHVRAAFFFYLHSPLFISVIVYKIFGVVNSIRKKVHLR